MEKSYPVLQMAQDHWASERFLKEVSLRDRDPKFANKKEENSRIVSAAQQGRLKRGASPHAERGDDRIANYAEEFAGPHKHTSLTNTTPFCARGNERHNQNEGRGATSGRHLKQTSLRKRSGLVMRSTRPAVERGTNRGDGNSEDPYISDEATNDQLLTKSSKRKCFGRCKNTHIDSCDDNDSDIDNLGFGETTGPPWQSSTGSRLNQTVYDNRASLQRKEGVPGRRLLRRGKGRGERKRSVVTNGNSYPCQKGPRHTPPSVQEVIESENDAEDESESENDTIRPQKRARAARHVRQR